jgi:hypothetical protein
MKRVVYHRLAANELIETAVFYEKQRARLGSAFLAAIERDTRQDPGESSARPAGTGRFAQFQGTAVSLPLVL